MSYVQKKTMFKTALAIPVMIAPIRKLRQKQHRLSTIPEYWSGKVDLEGLFGCVEVMFATKEVRRDKYLAFLFLPKQGWVSCRLCQKSVFHSGVFEIIDSIKATFSDAGKCDQGQHDVLKVFESILEIDDVVFVAFS